MIIDAQCYKANGVKSNDIPCGFSSLSTCCGEGWDCLSNGLCRKQGTTAYSQGTCTDPEFRNCLSFCNQGTWIAYSKLPLQVSCSQVVPQDQFDGFTEVSRCEPDDNSWCCAGSPGQGLGGPDCCTTNLTTPLEPYPFSSIDALTQTGVATTTSLLSTDKLTSTSLSSSLTRSFTSMSSLISPSWSSIASQQPSSPSAAPTNGSSNGNAPNSGLSRSDLIAVCIGVPVGAATMISTFVIVVNYIRKRKRERRRPTRP